MIVWISIIVQIISLLIKVWGMIGDEKALPLKGRLKTMIASVRAKRSASKEDLDQARALMEEIKALCPQ